MRSRLEGQLREDNSPRGRIQNETHIYHIHHHDHSPNHDHTPSEYLPHTHSSDDLLRNRNDHTHYYDHLLLAAEIVLLLFCLIYLAFLHDGVWTNLTFLIHTVVVSFDKKWILHFLAIFYIKERMSELNYSHITHI